MFLPISTLDITSDESDTAGWKDVIIHHITLLKQYLHIEIQQQNTTQLTNKGDTQNSGQN